MSTEKKESKEELRRLLARAGWHILAWADRGTVVHCILTRAVQPGHTSDAPDSSAAHTDRPSDTGTPSAPKVEVQGLSDVLAPSAPRRQRVLRVLLSHIGREWKIIELAAEAKVSPATASKVVGALVREALAEYLGRGPQKTMRLVAPARLLDEWARDWRLGRRGKTGYYCLARNPDELKQRLAEAARQVGARLGFTLAAGADFYGPYIRDDIIHAHFVGLERDFAEAAGLQPALSGANIILYHARDEGILYLPDKLRDQLKLPEDHAAGPVCPVQLYLDMKAARGRYAEQAEKLRQEVIGY